MALTDIYLVIVIFHLKSEIWNTYHWNEKNINPFHSHEPKNRQDFTEAEKRTCFAYAGAD